MGGKIFEIKGQSLLLRQVQKLRGEQYFVTHTSNFCNSGAAVCSTVVS